MQSRFFVFAITCVAALQMSSGLAARGLGDGNQGAPGHISGRSGGKTGSKTLTVTKDCGATPAEGELPYCTITASNFPPLMDAKIRYFGPKFFAETQPYLESWVLIESAKGTAFGHCLVRGVPGVLGACQFTGGSGSLKGFKADVTVTTVDFTIWHWNGSRSNGD